MRFREMFKVVEKYYEAGLSSICINCAEIGYNRLGKCLNKAIQCIIYTIIYRTKNYKYKVTGYIIKID